MRTEDLFKCGVTPKNGEDAGKRFKVKYIGEEGVSVEPWAGGDMSSFKNGEYELWHAPKTLFEDNSMICTLGNLIQACRHEGLPEDTRIFVREPWPFGNIIDATARLSIVNDKKAIIMF